MTELLPLLVIGVKTNSKPPRQLGAGHAVLEGVEMDGFVGLGGSRVNQGTVSKVVFVLGFQKWDSDKSQYTRHSAMPAPQRCP
jgi:hypothetical protein